MSTTKLLILSLTPNLLSIHPDVVTPFLELPWYTQLQWLVSMFVGIFGACKMFKTLRWQHRRDMEYKRALKAEGQELKPWFHQWGRMLRWLFADKIMKARKKEASDEQAK